ncbi:MAG: hypothetical protein HGB14_06855 [Anaerolineaceae bacterium]|nr:hypothetical protein [Anaerolineaceae bacterium]
MKKLSRGVALVGAGMTKFGAFKDKTSRDLFVEAFVEMLESVDKGINPKEIEAMYVGNFTSDLFENQSHIAPILASWIGVNPIPATRVEDACASAGVALRQGILAIASGLYDIVLVGGVEKMTDLATEKVTDSLAIAADSQYEIPAGFTFPGFYAAMATSYMDAYDVTPETFMKVGIKNHNNGSLNEKAQFGAKISTLMEARRASAAKKGLPVPEWKDELAFLSDDRANPIVAWPMRLYDCSPISDGAAVVLLVSEDLAKKFSDNPIYVVGSGQASDGALHDRETLNSIPAAKLAGEQAYQMAGITPQDIDFAEVHDCFTIAEIIATEDLGFFERGKGGIAAEENETSRTGKTPINLSGGLKSKGHPVGASGVGQVVEVWKQLRGTAGERQLAGNLKYGLTHNVGGTGQTCVVHIFEKRN